MVARQPRPHSGQCRDRAPRPHRGGQWRRVFRAGPFPGSTRRIGARVRAASSRASPATPTRATSPAPALEATAYQTREVIEAMETDSGIAIKELRADGGMGPANDLLMQFQANLLAVPVLRPKVDRDHSTGRRIRGRPRHGLLGRHGRPRRQLGRRPSLAPTNGRGPAQLALRRLGQGGDAFVRVDGSDGMRKVGHCRPSSPHRGPSREKLEASPGIEPGCKDLQSSA